MRSGALPDFGRKERGSEMYKLTADQAEEFDPTTSGWKAPVLIRLSEFPEVEGRRMVFQRDAYTRGSERLVIEWDRYWTISALARNGHWATADVTWESLQTLIRDKIYPRTKVKVTGAAGYADFEGELILDSEHFPSFLLVGFEWGSSRDVAVVPRSCVEEI